MQACQADYNSAKGQSLHPANKKKANNLVQVTSADFLEQF